jgi:hypothetical protein
VSSATSASGSRTATLRRFRAALRLRANLLGLLFAPSNAGKSLDEIQAERAGSPDEEPRFTGEDAPARRERIAAS